MKQPRWIKREECLGLHEMMIRLHGGIHGVRDEHLLDSALAKPQNQFAYGTPTDMDLAASYASGVVKNHPFLDGNKRKLMQPFTPWLSPQARCQSQPTPPGWNRTAQGKLDGETKPNQKRRHHTIPARPRRTKTRPVNLVKKAADLRSPRTHLTSPATPSPAAAGR